MQNSALFDLRLATLRRRVRLLLAERAALAAGASAAAIGLMLVILDKFHLLRLEWAYLALLLAGALAAGWTWGFFRPLTDFDVARLAESRLALKERLSSATALGSLADKDPIVSALVEDAAGHLSIVQPSRLFPRHLGKREQIFLGLLLLLAAALVLPELPLFQSTATRQERAALRREGQELVKVALNLEKRPLPQNTDKVLQQVARNLKTLGKDMQTARVTRKQALVRLNKVEKQLESARSKLSPALSRKSLAQAAAELKTSPSALAQTKAALYSKTGRGAAGAVPLTEEQRKALEKLAQSLKPSTAQQLLDLDTDLASKIAELLAKGDVQEALKIMERLAKKLQDDETLKKLSPDELKQLSEELRKLAEALKNTDLDALAKELLEQAKALERGDVKLCKKCAGKVGKLCLGLGGKCNAALRLNVALQSLGQCRSGLCRGVGPGDGRGQYDPNAPHNVNRGTATRIPTQHYDTLIPGQQDTKGAAYSVQVYSEPDKANKAQVPYYEVYSDYSKAAENALNREDIPASQRERVKTYFESLQPK